MPREGCNTRSIYKWSKAGLNSEFSFSKTGCPTKIKEFSLPIYTYLGEEEMDLYLSQGHQCEVKCKQPCPGFELMPTYLHVTVFL